MAHKWINPVKYVSAKQYHSNGSQHQWSFMDQALDSASDFYRKNLYGHYGCVNAVEFSLDGQYLASGADLLRLTELLYLYI